MKTRHILLSCLFLTALSHMGKVAGFAEVLEDDGKEALITVVTNSPETTYSGKMRYVNKPWGLQIHLQLQYKPGEEFCSFIPVLGRRNFTCYVRLSKFRDIFTEVTLRNSDGIVLAKQNVTLAGKRPPYAMLSYFGIQRHVDIFHLCIRNFGSAKAISHSVVVANFSDFDDYSGTLAQNEATHNLTFISLKRVASQLIEMQRASTDSLMFVGQDYYTLSLTAAMIDGRGLVSTLLMLLTSFLSTVLIRRWFGRSGSSV